MKLFASRLIAVIVLMTICQSASAQIVIGHRGASGERPEHTLASYERAIDAGVDYVEPDLVPTKDGALVARHENEISGTTNVALHPEFAARKATRLIDGKNVTGWFTEDFTLAELRTLRARERLPELRKANSRFDGLFQIPTFAEVVRLVRAKEAISGRKIGLYPEIKHPAYFAARGIDGAAMLLAALKAEGLDGPDARIFIQCFEVAPLQRLHGITRLPLVQLIQADEGPADQPGQSYAAMITPQGLKQVAAYANVIGVEAKLVIGADGKPTPLVAQAHAAGLKVHVWTLRRENYFLPPQFRRGTDLTAEGDFAAYWKAMIATEVDGVFTDNPASVPHQ